MRNEGVQKLKNEVTQNLDTLKEKGTDYCFKTNKSLTKNKIY